MDEKTICEIEKKIGYVFRNKKILVAAFTHSSFSNENDAESNGKLEFLGDSLLNFIISEFLYDNMPNEGALTAARAKIVSAAPLANAAKKLDLSRFLQMGIGASKEKVSQKFHSDIFEALLGAIYLDGGLAECRRFASNNLDVSNCLESTDYKTKLQEFVQSNCNNSQIIYRDSFDEKEKKFMSEVYVSGKMCGTGKGVRKKEAQQSAARSALEKLNLV